MALPRIIVGRDGRAAATMRDMTTTGSGAPDRPARIALEQPGPRPQGQQVDVVQAEAAVAGHPQPFPGTRLGLPGAGVRFLAPPGVSTLPVVIYSAIRQGYTPEINAISTIIILVSMGLMLVIARLYKFGGER